MIPRRRRWVPVAGLAAAAGLATLLLWLPRAPSRDVEPVMRSPRTVTVQPIIEDGSALPADRFLLRWSAGPAGARYDIRVTDDSLDRLAGAMALNEPEYLVPADALDRLADGDLVLWQVDAVPPDGSRTTSSTFSQRVARP